MIRPQGLAHHQVQRQLIQWGPNVITYQATRSGWQVVAEQFTSGLTILLLLAAAGAGWLGDWLDAGLILAILVLNAGLGAVQELKAEQAILKLKSSVSFRVRVVRGGWEEEIDSRQLVPQDVVHLEPGSRVPADGQVLMSFGLEIDEAVLSGESLAVPKAGGDEIFAGTVVARGKGWMRVTTTGNRTKFGSLTGTLAQMHKIASPLQKNLTTLSRLMLVGGITAGVVVIALTREWLAGVSLAVAVVPEGLPAVIAVALAVGAQRLAAGAAVVRKLSAIEALGAATVVATDKTGTVTQNVMEVNRVVIGKRQWPKDHLPDLTVEKFSRLVLAGVLCNSSILVERHDHGSFAVVGDETEGALLKLAQKTGLIVNQVRQEVVVEEEFPFDLSLRLMTVVVKDGNGKRWIYTKGAPEEVLRICRLTKLEKKDGEEVSRQLAGEGLRVMALAGRPLPAGRGRHLSRAEAETGLQYFGLVGIADPIRPEAQLTVEAATRAGLRVVMITGDHELTAHQIAVQAGMVGVGEEIMTGDELERLTEAQLEQEVSRVRVFARIKPEHKLRIVTALQKRGELVVVTGDGVNDVLALKQADVGVAMGRTGTDVAREVADVVLVDDNLATLVQAIATGRTIMANIGRSVRYLLACNWGELLTILGAIFITGDLPLLPVQILWINLVTDGLPALALAVDGADKKALARGPVKSISGWIWGRREGLITVGAGTVMAAVGVMAFILAGRAAVFTALVALQLAFALVVRGWRRPNRWLMAAVGTTALLQVGVLAVPQLRMWFKL